MGCHAPMGRVLEGVINSGNVLMWDSMIYAPPKCRHPKQCIVHNVLTCTLLQFGVELKFGLRSLTWNKIVLQRRKLQAVGKEGANFGLNMSKLP